MTLSSKSWSKSARFSVTGRGTTGLHRIGFGLYINGRVSALRFPPLPLQVSPVTTVTFAFPPTKPSRETPGEREREGDGERGGRLAGMISSLQQLHSAARRARNFLPNFQVASPGKAAGYIRFEPERTRYRR